MKKIRIFDTTLRDGEQTAGVHLSSVRKLEIARQLERYGVDVIEAGFPASSKQEAASVAAIAASLKKSAVCALCRADRRDIDAAYAAVRPSKRPVLHVFIATSDIHLEYKLKKTRDEVLSIIADAVSYAAATGAEVEFSAEDATRSDRDFLVRAVEAAIASGAKTINLPDTVGYSMPEEYADLFRYVIANAEGAESVVFSAHCHNDLGVAVANSLAALSAGAMQVEGTVNGIGERAGNAALEEVVMAINTRGELLGLSHGIDIGETARTARLVSSLSGLQIPPNKAIVGKNAFLHEAGIHQHGVLCNRSTYEIMTPEALGFTKAGMPLGKLSGRHAFIEKLTALGYEFDTSGLDKLYAAFKSLAARKPEITDVDIVAMVNDYLDSLSGAYKLDSFQIQSGNRIKSMAMITLLRTADGEQVSEAALGEGPIDAAFNAVDRIAGADSVTLESYDIKAVTEGTDALGEVMVKIRVGEHKFAGRGVSSDIIKASIKAYVNAVNKWLIFESNR